VPELPEVETIVREIAPRLTGRRITRAALAKTDILRGVTKPRLLTALRRAEISGVTRRAKHAVFQLASGRRMVIQPGMSGSMIVYDRPLTPAEKRYAVLTCVLDDRALFVYRDVRRLGTILLLDERG
jgi:formamidopyrimidine-DNA glycosylase